MGGEREGEEGVEGGREWRREQGRGGARGQGQRGAFKCLPRDEINR